MTYGVLTGAEISAQDFEKLGGFRQPALLKMAFAMFGEEVGSRMADAMAAEFDSPTRVDRVIGLSEAASFITWALCGHPHAGELELAACEVLRPEGARLILPTDCDPIWPAMAGTLGGYVWDSLRAGVGLVPEIPGMTDQLTVAVGGFSCGASVTVATSDGSLVLHFGGIQPGDTRLALIETGPCAMRAFAADARALSVPSLPGSLAEQVQIVLASEEMTFAGTIH